MLISEFLQGGINFFHENIKGAVFFRAVIILAQLE